MAAAAVAKPAATPWGAQENEVGEANEPAQEEEEEEEDEIAALNEMINEQNAQWQQKYEHVHCFFCPHSRAFASRARRLPCIPLLLLTRSVLMDQGA
jgi:hypothetical protein